MNLPIRKNEHLFATENDLTLKSIYNKIVPLSVKS